MLLQYLPRTIDGYTANIPRTVRFPFVDAATIANFGIDEIALQPLECLGSPQAVTFTACHLVDCLPGKGFLANLDSGQRFHDAPSMSLSME